MNPVLDVFLDAGVNCMHPFEPTAHMDAVKIREKYGKRLSFYGRIDKHVLRQSQEAITAELENYRFYIKKAWEIIERSWGGG